MTVDQGASPEIIAKLHGILSRHQDVLISRSVEAVWLKIPAYHNRELEEVQASFSDCYQAYLKVLTTGVFSPMEDYMHQMVRQRSAEQVRLSAIQGAFLIFREVAFPMLVSELGGDYHLVVACLNHILAAESRALRLFADLYQDALTELLRQTNETLSQRNEDLQVLSISLDHRVAETTRELQHSRDFLSEIIENLKAGLIVVAENLEIKMFNQAMEKIAGIPRADALGQRMDDFLYSWNNISFSQLKEQLNVHGDVAVLKVHGQEDNVHEGIGGHFDLRMGEWVDAAGTFQGYLILIDDITDRELLLHSLSCYVSPKVAENILSAKDPISLAGSRELVTVLFADLRGFSFQSQKMSPEEMVELLNAYFGIMVEVVSRYEGTLDKFIGDCVMALFGAPVAIEDDAVKAVQCAVDMQDEVSRYSRRQKEQGNPYLYLGIGINRGEVLVGNIGSPRRMDYTAIGETVNLASRFQEYARGGEIIISDSVYQCVKEKFQVKALAPGIIKGANSRIPLYVVDGYGF
ncbi:MAG: PAS domain S-box protein [Xanthomonadaceae bacterium]|nr:PAS domain S-box protein [Xanthomonadaceae bacterium]